MSGHDLQRALYTHFARIGKALSNAGRLELLDILSQGERSVEVLARTAGLTIANTSQHLQQLRQAGLVHARKEGQHVYYRLSDIAVVDLLGAVHDIGERSLVEIRRLVRGDLCARDSLEPVAAHALLARLDTVTLLDVRPPEEYATAHVAGAINVPLERLAEHLEPLRAAAEVVAYCRGPYCVLAYEAVARLRAEGIDARRLAGGFTQWQAADLPVDHGSAQVHGPRKSR